MPHGLYAIIKAKACRKMSLIGLIIVLIIIGVILYCVNTLIPIDPKIKTIINILDSIRVR